MTIRGKLDRGLSRRGVVARPARAIAGGAGPNPGAHARAARCRSGTLAFASDPRGARRAGVLAASLALSCFAAVAVAETTTKATVDIAADVREKPVWPEVLGINLDYGGAAALSNPKAMDAVRKIGIRSIRFPNGCEADRYDWKADNRQKMTVEQFLTFCDAIGAEPYYTLNLQGGTEGRPGPPPAGAPVEEVIKHRHLAPNPCGYTDYHFGTLAETLELLQAHTIGRALAGRRPILCYEMGNENWGQGKTDWPPEVYAATVGAYARAMRAAVEDARRQHASLKDLRLHITAVSYPMVGNNQDPLQATDRDVNVRWTRELNALFAAGLIDAVQDHFYPYSAEGSDLLVWTHHNLQNLFFARRGLANPLLGGYRDEALAFRMPIEITEWNLKCWGPARTMLKAKNLEFEQGTSGWIVESAPAGSTVKPVADGGRRNHGLRLETGETTEARTAVFQVFPWKGGKAKRIYASAWVRTARPEALTLRLATVDAGGHPGEPLAEAGLRQAWRAGHWHKITVGGPVPEGATQLAVGFMLAGANVSADIDAVELYYWEGEHGLAPVSVDTAAQQLLLVDALRVMIEHGVRRAHLHHLFGGYPCGIMLPDGRTKENYKVFRFFTGRLGTHTAKATVSGESFDYDSLADKHATAFNALAPDVKGVPVVSALAMRDDRHVYLLAVNRSTDQAVDAVINVRGAALAPRATVRSLTCRDFDLPGVQLRETDISADASMTHRLEPHAAYLFRYPVR